MRYEPPGATIDVALSGAPTGLTGTMAVRLMKVVTSGADTIAVARTTAGIVENPAGSGIYQASITLPSTVGDYYAVWDDGSTFTRDDDTIRVTYNGAAPAGVVGAPYFTVAEFRVEYGTDVEPFEDERIEAKRAEAEETIEGLKGNVGTHVAFVPRTETFTFSGIGSVRIGIPRYEVTEVLDCTVDGVAVDPSELTIAKSSVFRNFPYWGDGEGNITLTVVHGLSAPPLRVKSAAMLLTKELLINGPIDSRASQIQTDSGGLITLALPGRAGYVTGIPEVDAAISQFARPRIKATSVIQGDSGNRFRGS